MCRRTSSNRWTRRRWRWCPNCVNWTWVTTTCKVLTVCRRCQLWKSWTCPTIGSPSYGTCIPNWATSSPFTWPWTTCGSWTDWANFTAWSSWTFVPIRSRIWKRCAPSPRYLVWRCWHSPAIQWPPSWISAPKCWPCSAAERLKFVWITRRPCRRNWTRWPCCRLCIQPRGSCRPSERPHASGTVGHHPGRHFGSTAYILTSEINPTYTHVRWPLKPVMERII